MAKKNQAPTFVRVANVMTTTLLRIGVPLNGFGKIPMYLMTVRGRKSGLPRTIPIALIERDGKRYLFSPFGVVDWVRNLRAAGEATLKRGHSTEKVRAIEMPVSEAGPLLKEMIASGNPIGGAFGISKDASDEDFERKTSSNPVFLMQSISSPASEAAREAQLAQ